MMDVEPDEWTFVRALRDQSARDSAALFCEFDGGGAHSFGDIDKASDACATGLARHGIGAGDHVMIVAPNCFEFLVAFFAVQKRRAVLVPVNTELRGALLEHQIRTARPRMVMSHRNLAEECPGAFEPDAVFVGIGDADVLRKAAIPFKDLLVSPDRELVLEPEAKDICLVLYTSGTSGPSKGVLITQAHAYLFALQQQRALRVAREDRYLVALPMFHVNALLMSLGACLIAGASAFVVGRFSASKWLSDIRVSGATITNMLGVMAEFILQQPESDDREHNLRRVMAVPVSEQWAEVFCSRFGVRLVQVYGMTECNMVSFTDIDEELIPGCVGPVSEEYFEVDVVDPETDAPLEAERIGEIVVRPKVPFGFMQGYLGMAETTVTAWRNLWFHTGDAGRWDAQGRLYFVDRIGDCIRRRGENISSFEIEQVLLTNESVVDCAAIGIKVPGAGGEDEVCVYVVTKGIRLDWMTFTDWCVSKLPRYAVPRYFRVVDTIEKTPTGKVKKRDLRDLGVTPDMWDREQAGYKLARAT
jgi:crotonobetaine/carnitine-CoA ligase